MLTSPRNVEFVEKCVKSITDKPPHKPLDSAGVCGVGTPDDPVRTSAWEALPGGTQQGFIRGCAGAPPRDDLTPSHIR